MLLAMALAAMSPSQPNVFDLPSCGGRVFIFMERLFSKRADSGNAAGLGALFDDDGVWLYHGRAVTGPKEVRLFFKSLSGSGMTIDLPGNYAMAPLQDGVSFTGDYVERRVAVPITHSPGGAYSMDLRCKDGRWKIVRLETPRQ